jgi:hypothetical protein
MVTARHCARMTIAWPSQLCVKKWTRSAVIAYSAAISCAREAVHSAMVRDERLIGQVM